VSNYTLLQGHCLEVLRTLPAESVQTCITSPPYFGLRDYGCDGQIGLETTPDSFVASLVDVFAEVHRVLKKDGTLWLNIGDSYNGAASNRTGQNGYKDGRTNRDKRFSTGGIDGLKPKDLIGIPWRVAFALQSYGWYLRQDIIWHKPNPMPESVTDRCTKAHEYIFLLSKSDRYFYDNEAIKEPVSDTSLKRAEYGWNCDRPSTKNASMGGTGIHTEKMGTRFVNPSGRNKRSVWTVNTKPYKGAHFAVYPTELIRPCVLAGSRPGDVVLDPFNGSGTTGFVSMEERRKYIGIDINTEYLAIAEARIKSAQVQETMEFDSEA
jgi:DNA modification methylase